MGVRPKPWGVRPAPPTLETFKCLWVFVGFIAAVKAKPAASVGEVWADEASSAAPLDGREDIASIEERQAEVEAARVRAQGADKIGVRSDAGQNRIVAGRQRLGIVEGEGGRHAYAVLTLERGT